LLISYDAKRRLTACLVGFWGLFVFSYLPAEPLPEFERRDFGFARIDVPRGWYVRHREGGGTRAVFITLESIEKHGRFQTGLSVNAIRDIPKKTSLSATAYAKGLIEKMAQTHQNRGIVEHSAGVLKGWASFFRSKSADGNMVVQYTIASGNDETGSAFVVTFESPEMEWHDTWKMGSRLVQSVSIKDDY
jgi:hypothetical protein